ncbi:MAG TPA: acyl-CoA thioesterase, partial [Vicinamibacteria bacterium]|nr:acyl-CoA thioesterase [Vicinamibacteria bacterium]
NVGERIKVTEGLFTFVAIDDNRRPRPLPPEGGA